MNRLKSTHESGKTARKQSDTDIHAAERKDITRLSVIIAAGFGVARGYNDMNRDRFHVTLQDGVTIGELYRFCNRFLNGSPVPGADPISEGPVLKGLFEAAQKANLVTLDFVKAGVFVPERGS